MYKRFFNLSTDPFGASPDPQFLFMMPQIRESLACLQYGIAARRGFVVMTGEVGTGKTTLLKAVLATFAKSRLCSAFVFNPRFDVLDFFEFVLTDFGIPPKARTKSGMVLQLNHWLIDRFREGGLCVLVIDEAQNLTAELLEEIRLLTNLETSSEKLLQVVLSGQPELDEKLRHPSLRQLRQRIAVRARTRPLSVDETRDYIAERLRLAGAENATLLPDAVGQVYQYSNGIPRLINLICEHALISAYVEQIKPVPARIVESVAMELDLDQQPYSGMPNSPSGPQTNVSPLTTAGPASLMPRSPAACKDNLQ